MSAVKSEFAPLFGGFLKKEERRCRRCKTISPIEEFPVDSRGTRYYTCKSCLAEIRFINSLIRGENQRGIPKPNKGYYGDKSLTSPCEFCGGQETPRVYYWKLGFGLCQQCKANLDDACRTFTNKKVICDAHA